ARPGRSAAARRQPVARRPAAPHVRRARPGARRAGGFRRAGANSVGQDGEGGRVGAWAARGPHPSPRRDTRRADSYADRELATANQTVLTPDFPRAKVCYEVRATAPSSAGRQGLPARVAASTLRG